MKNIKWIKIFGEERVLKEFDTRKKKADYFLDRCILQISNPEYIINEFKITNKNDIKTLEKFCKVYRAKGYNRFFWDTVIQEKTNEDEKSISYDYNPLQQPVTQPSRPALPAAQTVEQSVAQPAAQPTEQPAQTVQPVQQQSVIENAMNEQVQQRTGRHAPTTQPDTQSVFNGDQEQKSVPLTKKPREELIEKLVKLINSKDAFKNALTTFAIRKNIDGADVSIIIKNIFNSKNDSPKSLFTEYIMDLYKNPAASKYEMDIAGIEGLFKAIDGYDYY